MWNPQQYLQFQQERDRPFFDLLAQVQPQTPPHTVADLGCGTGHLTAALAKRWPEATVLGLDSSAEMLSKAAYAGPNLTFQQADLREWQSAAPLEVLFSNAALQWVDDHARLIPRLAGLVAAGGTFAFQVPGNFEAPSHILLAEVLSRPRWANLQAESRDKATLGAFGPAQYTALLAPLGFTVNAWETTYLHLLPALPDGANAVLEWVKGTALRPVLAQLDGAEAAEFLAEYGSELARAYPVQDYGTPFPFRRVFVVARKG
ncbi:methyltransferase domain-containing protein [Deinococcus aquatilis]|jgi:trans-aconitate 2-methyltransferase|uniref:methyltransferase domain-containing protein n=1 Tax=Deinococcus aquatilis TaxID=519440 RepID=UPI00035D363F|nr:methyltransferase domain-containing protein [Deinococcus aquatilis]